MKCRIALLVTAVSVLLLMGLNLLWYQQAGEEEIPQRVWHHELAAQADMEQWYRRRARRQ